MTLSDIAPSYQPDGKSLLDPTWDREWVLFEGASQSDGKNWPNWETAYYDGDNHYFEWENGFREHYDLVRDPHQLSSTLSPERTRRALERAKRDTAPFRRKLRQAADCIGPLECP